MKRCFDPRMILFLLMVAVLVMFAGPTWAGGECNGNGNCSDTVIDAGSSVSNSIQDTSRAIGLGAGDVDIAQCYRSYSVIIWQDSRINPICLADSLDAKGLHRMAALVRCDIKAIRKHFTSDDDCIDANTVRQADLIPHEPVAEFDEDEDEYHEEQLEMYEDLMAKVRNLEAAQTQRPIVRREVIEQRVGLSDEQKAALKEVVK